MEKFDFDDLDGRQLRLLIAVFETGSLTRAGFQLGLNQSTVSYRIDLLRQRLNDPLFIRTRRGVTPTARLEGLIPLARNLLRNLQNFVEPPLCLPAEDTGVLRIAASAPECDLFIAPLFSRLLELTPKVRLDVVPTGADTHPIDGFRVDHRATLVA